MYIGELGIATTPAEKKAMLEALYARLMSVSVARSLPEMRTIRQAIDAGRLDSAMSQIVTMEKWVEKRTGQKLGQATTAAPSGWGLTEQMIAGVPNWALYVGVAAIGVLAATKFGKKKGK